MDWLKQMNDALAYLEENLDGEIDLSAAAQKACCSVYHFQRMFSYMAEVPLSEYIRRRRLSRAAFDLQNTDGKVIDIALKYGYDSPTAFTRAFQNLHGIAPNTARKKGAALKAYPPIAFQVTIKGAVIMNYRIEEKEAFRVVGVKLSTTIEDGVCYKDIPKFWQNAGKSGNLAKLVPMLNQEPHAVLGLSVCNEPVTGTSRFDYYIAVATDKEPEGSMESFTVPAATWAVFECIGPMPNAIQDMQKRITTEWLPSSGYQYGNAPDIEVYYDEDGSRPDTRSEIWIPVVKK